MASTTLVMFANSSWRCDMLQSDAPLRNSLIIRNIALMIVSAGSAGAALAQSNIDPTHKFAWSENTGWTNWHDAGNPVGAQGVQVGGSFLSGFIWSENAGWINVGDGTPTNSVSYAN